MRVPGDGAEARGLRSGRGVGRRWALGGLVLDARGYRGFLGYSRDPRSRVHRPSPGDYLCGASSTPDVIDSHRVRVHAGRTRSA
jgi:hypothetical protein